MIQAYNYLLLENFPAKREVMYPAKNRGELKKVYNSIVSLSKSLPFYKIDLSQENQEYAIGIKENALELKDNLKSMQELDAVGFHNKKVSVSNNTVSAELLKEDTQNLPDIIKIKVNKLANGQVNRGKELMNSSLAFPPGEYEFNAQVNNETYLLNFIQSKRKSNQETINDLADYLNRNVPGIIAASEKAENKDYSRLTLVSDLSGRFGDKKFSFEDDEVYGEGVVDFFGLNRVETPSSNSDFELNGIKKQTATNSFSLENTLHISLNGISEQPVTLRITQDSDKILKSVDTVISTYNNLIGLAKDRSVNNNDYSASKLISEMKSMEKVYHEELTACGIKAKEDGTLQLDDSLAVQAAEDGGMESLFNRENGFMARLIDKSEAIAINPMDYLEKTVVIYPNNGRNSYSNPYVTSMYSGLLFSSYC